MYYDYVIGERVTRLVRQFVAGSNPGQKIALVGDPGSISNTLYIRTLSFVYLLLGTPGFNFINVLRTAFMHVDPECAKKDSQVSIVILRFWAPGA